MTTTERPAPLDAPTALRLLREVVAGREDYLYRVDADHCVYVLNGCPSCIIAHVLARAGWTVELLATLDEEAGGDGLAAASFDDTGIATYEAARILGAAQLVQDRAQLKHDDTATWGAALAAAEEKAAELGVTA